MRLTIDGQNQTLDQIAALLAHGTLRIFEGSRPTQVRLVPTFRDALVVIPLEPAFPIAVDGQTTLEDLPAVQIQQTGRATWAELVTASETLIGDLSVGTERTADVQVDRADFQSGGLCRIQSVTLRLRLL